MSDLNVKIIPLQTSEAGRVPDDATMDGLGVPRLDQGEIAINLTDKKIYSKNAAGEIVTLGAGADEEEGDGLPGGGFKPNYQAPLTPLFRYVFSATANNLPQVGEVQGSTGNGWDLTFSLIDADGEDRTTPWTEFGVGEVLRIMDAAGTELWNAAISDIGNIDSNIRVTVNLTNPDTDFGFTAGDEVYVDLYQSDLLPTDELVEIPLEDGDALRYDGAFWRPVKYKLETLDDTDIASAGVIPITWVQQQTSSQSGGQAPGESYQDTTNSGHHPQAYINGELVNIQEPFEAWIQEKTGIDVSADRTGGDWTSFTPFDTVVAFDDVEYTVTVTQFRNRSNASQGYDPRFSLHYPRPAQVPDATGAIMRLPEFEVFYAANYGGGINDEIPEGAVLQYNTTTYKWTAQELIFSLLEAADVALRVDEGSGTEIPLAAGDALIWDGTTWRPANPLAGSSINALDDVNTVTNAPTAGQALVWDDANGYWKPGTVASEAPEITLEELTDTTITTPADGEVLKYQSGAWVNAALAYADISDAPTVPQDIGDLTSVDLSLAPTVGQVLVWNGTSWAPDDQTGGGGSGDSVVGALTERADVSITETLAAGASMDYDFSGLGEAGKFVSVQVSQPAWVRFYPTNAARSSDVTRQVDDDPQPGSGVLMEVRTNSPAETVLITPGAVYYNNDILPSQVLYARVQNQSGASAAITVTIRAYTQTSTDAISGGTFGSG